MAGPSTADKKKATATKRPEDSAFAASGDKIATNRLQTSYGKGLLFGSDYMDSTSNLKHKKGGRFKCDKSQVKTLAEEKEEKAAAKQRAKGKQAAPKPDVEGSLKTR